MGDDTLSHACPGAAPQLIFAFEASENGFSAAAWSLGRQT